MMSLILYEQKEMTVYLCVFVLNSPPTAVVIWRQGHGFSLIAQTGEPGDQTHEPWL